MKKFILLITVFVFTCQLHAQIQRMPKCSPWRSVTGYPQLCTELSSFNCARIMCKGASNTTVITNSLLQDINNSIYTFSSVQSISVVIQNKIIAQARNWANANKPAGYAIEIINYIPDIITSSGTITYAGIDIKVTYKKCTGPIALPN
ncbi:hypothetical protein [Ferruginibacter sp.]|nr:hypothetical protein [Ferruginibacter sp.]